ncbi:MAG: hypothetical protein M9928_19590 [Anaerolineae bacterium]|nr:hypothetical protein [Anaerolineae bacterium]
MASDDTMADRSAKIRERLLQLMVDAALDGHELTPFGDIGFGVQAVCQRCDRWVQVTYAGLTWNRLGSPCHGKR